MKIMILTAPAISAGVEKRLRESGWDTLCAEAETMYELALRFTPDFLLIQASGNSMVYRGLLTRLFKQGIRVYIVFFTLFDGLQFATTKRLEEPFISLYPHRQTVLDALFQTLDSLGIPRGESREFKEDDYITTTSMTFHRGEHMREIISGLQESEFRAIVKKLGLPFAEKGYYLLTMNTVQEFNIDYRNNRRIYYLLEVIRAKTIWAMLEGEVRGILFRGHSRNVDGILINAPVSYSSQRNQEILQRFLNAVYQSSNDGLTAFVLSSFIPSAEGIGTAYEQCLSLVPMKVFYPHEPILRQDVLAKTSRAPVLPVQADQVLQPLQGFEADTPAEELRKNLRNVFLSLVRDSRDMTILNYCHSTLHLIYEHFCVRYSLPEEEVRLPQSFDWNLSLEDLVEIYYERFLHAQETVRNHQLNDDPGINTAIRYIRTHYSERLTLEDLARRAGYNPAYFSRKFKASTGSNVSKYIEQHRMEKAKAYLSSGMKVYEAAAEVGYSDARLFSKRFREYTGLSPTVFRRPRGE